MKQFLAFFALILFSGACLALDLTVENLVVLGGDGVGHFTPDQNSIEVSFDLVQDSTALFQSYLYVTLTPKSGTYYSYPIYYYQSIGFFPGSQPIEIGPIEGAFDEYSPSGEYVLNIRVGSFFSEDVASLTYMDLSMDSVSIEVSRSPPSGALPGEPLTYDVTFRNNNPSRAFDGNFSFRDQFFRQLTDLQCTFEGIDLNEDTLWVNGGGFPLHLEPGASSTKPLNCTCLEGMNRLVSWVGYIYGSGDYVELARKIDLFNSDPNIITFFNAKKLRVDFLEIIPNQESYKEGDLIEVTVKYKNISQENLTLPEHKIYLSFTDRNPVQNEYYTWWYTFDTYRAYEYNIPALAYNDSNTVTISLGNARSDIDSFQITTSLYTQMNWWCIATDIQTFNPKPRFTCDIIKSEIDPSSEPNCSCIVDYDENNTIHTCVINYGIDYYWLGWWYYGVPQTVDFYIDTSSLESVKSDWFYGFIPWAAYPGKVSILLGTWAYGGLIFTLATPTVEAVPGPGPILSVAALILSLSFVFIYSRKITKA